MSRLERSTPLENLSELYGIYGEDDPTSLAFFTKIEEMQRELQGILRREDLKDQGVVLSVDGTWGSGKTTFMNLVLKGIEEENVVLISYDCLFYGNVSEATTIFLDDIFKKIRETFGINLQDSGIAKNISPKFEVGYGLPKLVVDLNQNNRYPTEFIKDKLAEKLKKINGKVIIVIDDLDRVSGEDVIHFLRIVRVLRELPNFVVILPIDKGALEDLLQAKQIANPRQYLKKIIDWSTSVEPDQGNARMLFINKITNLCMDTIDPNSMDELWKMTLLRLAIHSLDSEDIRNTNVTLGVAKADQIAQQYERKARSISAGNNSLMRGFMDRASRQFGAPNNLVTKVVNETTPQNLYFRSVISLYGSQNFTDLLNSQASPALSGADRLDDQSQNIMLTKWWRDSDYIVQLNNNNPDENYTIGFPNATGINLEQANEHLTNNGVTLWSVLRNIIEAFYPEIGLRYLAPRSINKIVAAFDAEVLNTLLVAPLGDTNAQMTMYSQVINAVDNVVQE